MACATRRCNFFACALPFATLVGATQVAAAPVMARLPFRQFPGSMNPQMLTTPRINPITNASSMMASYGQGMMYAPNYPRMINSSGYPNTSASNYGAGTAGSNSSGAQTAALYTAPSTGNAKSAAFQGFMNANGSLDWPLALRILPPSLETTPHRARIDSLIQQVQTEAGKGKVDSALLKEANSELSQLRERLADKADFLPVSQQATTDARQFVRRLQGALKTIE
jgi:hypothetical protein